MGPFIRESPGLNLTLHALGRGTKGLVDLLALIDLKTSRGSNSYPFEWFVDVDVQLSNEPHVAG